MWKEENHIYLYEGKIKVFRCIAQIEGFREGEVYRNQKTLERYRRLRGVE